MILKTTSMFSLTRTKTGQLWIKLNAKLKNCYPTARHISESDARYLSECGKNFDAACVLDFGVGVFRKRT